MPILPGPSPAPSAPPRPSGGRPARAASSSPPPAPAAGPPFAHTPAPPAAKDGHDDDDAYIDGDDDHDHGDDDDFPLTPHEIKMWPWRSKMMIMMVVMMGTGEVRIWN